jgi:GNAT superfamily N-acetyltransferase
MRAKEFITEIERMTKDGYVGGKNELSATKLPKDLRPLPGGSGLQYSIAASQYTPYVISIVDPEHISTEPLIKGRWEYDNEYKKRLKAWEKIKGKPSPAIVARLSLYQSDAGIPNALQVSAITVHEDYRGIGLAKALYGIVLTIMKKTLVSGDSQTPGGRRNWLSLANIPGVEIKGVLALDTERVEDSRDENKIYDMLMHLGGQFISKGKYNEFWAFDVLPGNGELVPAVKNKLSQIYDEDSLRVTTGLFAKWAGQ